MFEALLALLEKLFSMDQLNQLFEMIFGFLFGGK